MKKMLIPAGGVVAVAVITWLSTLYLGNQSSPAVSSPAAGIPVLGELPSAKAQTSAKAFDEGLRTAEERKAALLRAQQVAAEKVVLVQLRDRLDGVRKLLAERTAEGKRWEEEVEVLLDNDDGRAVVAARFTRDVLGLIGERKRYELSEDATRNCLDLLLQPVAVALDDGQALFTPDSSTMSQVARLEAITREPTVHNRRTREAIRRLVEDARRSGLARAGQGTTLRAAGEEMRTDEVRQRLAVVSAQVEKHRTTVAGRWAARRIKLIDRIGVAKTDEVEAAFRSFADEERFEDPPAVMVAARQTLRDAFGKLEADQIEAEWRTCWRWTIADGLHDRPVSKGR